ncbi:YcaO-like family protein [Streptomyces sp. NPDC093514]|uniref:YcaO-like family protein n=1 Tax=Streptomyces sp. NPDC093514 TaxID=3366039 RepID=UPI0038024DB7
MTSPAAIRIGECEPVDSFIWVRGDEPPFIAMAGGQVAPWARESHRAMGAGVHVDREQAARAAICEVLERQSAFRLPRDGVVYASARDLARTADRRITVDPDTPGWWVLANPSGEGDQLAFPLEYVQFATPVRHPLTTVRSDSTGMAVHRSNTLAVAGGLAELTERTLRRRLLEERVAVRWDPATVTGDTAVYLHGLQSHGCEVTLVPARHGAWWVCAALVGGTAPCGEELLVGGSAASRSPHVAAERAVAEAYAKAFISGLASRPGEVPDAVGCNSATRREAADWLAGWGVHAAPLVPVGTVPDLTGVGDVHMPSEVFWVDRGDAYTDEVGLACTHVFSPAPRAGMPQALEAADLGWRVFG